MPKTTQVDYLHRLVFKCLNCGRTQEQVIHTGMKIGIGTVIKAYAGGGSWGHCIFCHSDAGLQAITEPPPRTKGPVGWKRSDSSPPSSTKTEK